MYYSIIVTKHFKFKSDLLLIGVCYVPKGHLKVIKASVTIMGGKHATRTMAQDNPK